MVYFKSTQAVFSSIVIGLIIIIINSHLLILNPPLLASDRNKVDCYGQAANSEDSVFIFKVIGMVLYSVVPSCLLFLMNAYFLYRAVFKKENVISPVLEPCELNRLNTKKKMVGLAITIITVGFLICTIPFAVTAVMYKSLWHAEFGHSGKLIIFTCDAISFTYHSAKLEMLLIYNSFFRDEFMKLVGSWAKNRVSFKFMDQLKTDSKVVTTEYTS